MSTPTGLPEERVRQWARYLDGAANHPEIRRTRAIASDLFRAASGERLLDAGCGLGEMARALGQVVGNGGEVIALDVSPDTVALAGSRSDGGPVRYVTGDVTELDFPDGYFDGVRAERLLQQLPSPSLAVAELARVTRTGGRVCLIDTDWTSLVGDGFDHLADSQEAAANTLGGAVRDTGRKLRAMLVAQGLSEIEVRPATVCFTDPGDAAVVIPFFDENAATALLPAQLSRAFRDSVLDAVHRGVFLAAVTIWIAVGRIRR